MKNLSKVRKNTSLNTYFEIMKVCGCGVCGWACTCGGQEMNYRLWNFPDYKEADYRVDYGNHTF